MKRNTLHLTGMAIGFLLIFSLFVGFACQKDDDEEEDIFEDDWGRGGSGGGNFGDDDTDDDDTTDDDTTDDDTTDDDTTDDDTTDDDTTDDDDTTETPSIVVVYGNSYQNTAYSNFFTAYGIEAVFVDEVNVPTFSFLGYNLILVTETCNFYQADQYEAIADSGKKVLGVYQGGAILFGKLGLWTDLGSGTAYDVTQITGFTLTHQIWSEPFDVDVTVAGLVNVASPSVVGWTHSTVNLPDDVRIFAEIWGATSRSIISYERSKYMLWGLQFSTGSYTEDALKLFANLIYFLAFS